MQIKIMRYFIFCFTILLFECSSNKSLKIKEDKNVAVRRINEITRETTYSISQNDSTHQTRKKITAIDSFNKNGLIIWRAELRYRYTASTQSKPQKKYGDLRDYVYLAPKQTNIYAAYCDSTLFEYNELNQLVKETRIWSENNGTSFRRVYLTYKYDTHGNQVEMCSLDDFGENHCSYTSLIYNEDGTIKLRIDSSNSSKYLSPWKGKSDEYEYDKNGNVLFDGYIRYSYDRNNNVVKKIAVRGWFDNEYFKYDDKNNLVELVTVSKSDTITFRCQFDERGLLIEEKEMQHRKKVSLSKHEYN